MHVRRPHAVVCGAIGVIASASAAMAQPELISNGGFETGNFLGWSVPPNVFEPQPNPQYFVVSSGGGHTGTYWTRMASTNVQYVSQILPTTSGQDYLLSYWIRRPSNFPAVFRVRFEGQFVFNQSVVLPDSTNWWQFTIPLHSNITGSLLEFGQSNYPFEFHIDDISVVQVPAPGAASVLGLSGLLAMRRPRRRGAP